MDSRADSNLITFPRFDRQLMSKLVRIQFHLALVEVKIGVAGLVLRCGWLPDDPVFDLIEEMAFGTTHLSDEVRNVFMDAWRTYRANFAGLEEFDPEPFVNWLQAGDFRSHPFQERPKGLWLLPRELPEV